MEIRIERFKADQETQIVQLSLRAWGPVFDAMRPVVQPYVYDNFFPDGWAVRQRSDVERILQQDADNVWVALLEDTVVGWVGLAFHSLDQMGEVRIMAVDPTFHRRGIAAALLQFSFDIIKQRGLKMVMVETGDDPGHAAARAAYERAGFVRWPVARYFRQL
ncbi:Acetyltransferase (GNAT) domain-containing protein [Devosia crocina]|uniref:Acetyltransferase (GNAT) domain-containing protein n=1 Tax=Devosia crocina TaxID=429728 RepID=A0A1I7NS90_9HYPH|nr:GNAT family N-acetyltransferase [Devosia crocina]SFV37475.1 Acetyltransferase (GNAT) domain-containing protein [Devosia crocina]